MTEEFYNDILQAYTNMTHWNNCHPAGGTDKSMGLERALRKFMDENPRPSNQAEKENT
jgi:hypothetical protein